MSQEERRYKKWNGTIKPQSLPPGYTPTTKTLLPKSSIMSPNSTTSLGPSIQNISLWETFLLQTTEVYVEGLRLMLGFFPPLLSSLFLFRQILSVKARAHQNGYPASSRDFLLLLSDIGIIIRWAAISILHLCIFYWSEFWSSCFWSKCIFAIYLGYISIPCPLAWNFNKKLVGKKNVLKENITFS